MGATFVGIRGYDDKLDDLSPDGFAAQADLARRTLSELDATDPVDERERVAKESMQERIGLLLERYESGELTSEINVISSGLHDLRSVFDLMPTEGEEAVANIAARLTAFAPALDQYKMTLLDAADRGHVSARHQMVEVAKQCDIWTSTDGDDFYWSLVRRLDAAGTLRAELDRGC